MSLNETHNAGLYVDVQPGRGGQAFLFKNELPFFNAEATRRASDAWRVPLPTLDLENALARVFKRGAKASLRPP